MTTLGKRVYRLEQAIHARRREVIWLKDGVYHRGAEVISQEEYEALSQTCDVLTVEVVYSKGVEYDE